MTHLPTKLHKMKCLRRNEQIQKIIENKNPEIIVSMKTQDMSPYLLWCVF